MTGEDLHALLPLLLLGVTPLAVMVASAVRRNHTAAALLSLVGLGSVLASLPYAARWAPRQVTGLLLIDRTSLVYLALLSAAGFAVVLMAWDYLERQRVRREELYLLLTISTFGAGIIVCSSHMASFFLGLELMTVPLYPMIAYIPSRRISAEAALKYLVLAGASSAIMLFGIALIYGATGTLGLAGLGALLATHADVEQPLVLAGAAMMSVGLGFKLAVVPMHMWTPDVYEGAPAPVGAFVATVSKGAVVGMLVRYFLQTGAFRLEAIFVTFGVMAAASMVVGNLLALRQGNLKRILAWSSIAHVGYVLVGLLAGGPGAVTFYVAVYFAAVLGAFAVISVCSEQSRDSDRLEEYRGLFWRRPGLAIAMTICMLSLIGMPLTAGFVGKFQIVAAGASSAMWALVLLLVVSSAVGLVYYLRVIQTLFAGDPEHARAVPVGHGTGRALLAALVVVLVWLGVAPAGMLRALTP
jgi:NADH-quinone oxidoreductase subunit N